MKIRFETYFIRPKMNCKNLFAIFIGILCLTSCSTPKDITYFQDVHAGSSIEVKQPYQVKVQPGDKLRIIVSTKDQRLSEMFNIQAPSGISASTSNEASNQLGYTVNPWGEIDFPQIGMQTVAGLTRDEIAALLKKELEEKDLIKDPVIVVDFLNMGVVVLGDVKSPGHYRITNDRFTILEALSMAGDLNITANRKNILVTRELVGRQEVYEINLLDAEQLYKSPAFFLQQNDVIYVDPNDKRKRESTINGNTALTYGFWMSLASFIMSTAVLITK